MEKRSDKSKCKKKIKKEKQTKVVMVLLCIALFASSIYIIDASTKQMMKCKDDRQAVGISYNDDAIFKIDLAGYRYFIKADKLIAIIDLIGENIDKLFVNSKESIQKVFDKGIGK